MKFALTAIVALPALAAALPQYSAEASLDARVAALKAEYDTIGPQLSGVGIDSLKDFGIDLSSLATLGSGPLTYYAPVDLALLRANGYADLANRLEQSATLSVESGEKGLVALKKVISSGMADMAGLMEANEVATEASDIGLRALAVLPKPETISSKTIADLRAMGLNNVARSLEGVQNGLIRGEKGSKFLKAFGAIGIDKDFEQAAANYDTARTVASIPYVAAPVAPAAAPIASGFYSYPQFGYAGYQRAGYPYYG